MPLIEISRYKTTPTSTSTRNSAPTARKTQNAADLSVSRKVSTTQPTRSETTSRIITTASVIGQLYDEARIAVACERQEKFAKILSLLAAGCTSSAGAGLPAQHRGDC